MTVGEICNRTVVVADRATPVTDAAKLMREHHVGSLVIVEDRAGTRVPVGILTDRDIVVAVLAGGVDPAGLSAGDVMAAELVTAREEDSEFDALQLMRRSGVRRVPVVGAGGALVGIVTLDDLLEVVAEQLDDIVRAIGAEQARERRARR